MRLELLVGERAYEERVSCKGSRLVEIWRCSESCYHCLCSTPRSNLHYEATKIPSSNVSVRLHMLPPAVVYSYSSPPHFVQSIFSGTLAGRSNETILQQLHHSPAQSVSRFRLPITLRIGESGRQQSWSIFRDHTGRCFSQPLGQ